MTIREQLQLMDVMREKNDAAFAEAARQQKREMWQTWIESFVCVACGALIGLLIVWIAG